MNRKGLSLVELLVVLAIIAGMIGLLLPAVQNSREAARKSVCQEHVRQIQLAIYSHQDMGNRVPDPKESWTVTILQWMEEKPLMNALKGGNYKVAIKNRPPLYKCPSQPDLPVDETGVRTIHYIMEVVPGRRKQMAFAGLRDRFADFETEKIMPWYDGPTTPPTQDAELEGKGPHAGLFNRSPKTSDYNSHKKGTAMIRLWLPILSALLLSMHAWAEDATPLKVGVFDVDVSPPVGSPLAYDPCNAVAMSLRASGVVIVGAEEPIVLCSVDWIGIANSAHTEWRRALAKATNTSIERVTVHTIHQHDAPFCDFSADAILAERGLGGLLFDVKFAQRMIDDVADAAKEAVRNATTFTHVGVGQATVEKVASNRRILGHDGKVRATRYTACADPNLRLEPEGVIDPRLKCISFWNEEQPIVVMTYYATHPQSYYRRGVANPDFPGMARFLRQVTLNGLPHIHFNGAGGNIGAGKYNDGSPENRQLLTMRMAKAMAAAYANTELTPISASDITWHSADIAIPPAPHLDAAKLLEVLDDANASNVDRGIAATDLAWLRRCRNGDRLTMTSINIGPASIVHLPGEPVVEYQLFAQQLQPRRFVAVAGYGDYGTGYICLEQHYQQGGYEASPRASRVAPHTEQVLKDAIRSCLRSPFAPGF